MDWKILLTAFGTVFAGAAGALVLTSAIGVAAGGTLSHRFSPRALSVVAGIGFIAIGVWTLVRPGRPAEAMGEGMPLPLIERSLMQDIPNRAFPTMCSRIRDLEFSSEGWSCHG